MLIMSLAEIDKITLKIKCPGAGNQSVTPSFWKIKKIIWKTVLRDSGLGKKERKKTTLLCFLIEIHPEDGFAALKYVFGLRLLLQNPKSGFQNLNPDFPMERNPRKHRVQAREDKGDREGILHTHPIQQVIRLELFLRPQIPRGIRQQPIT